MLKGNSLGLQSNLSSILPFQILEQPHRIIYKVNWRSEQDKALKWSPKALIVLALTSCALAYYTLSV